MDAESPLLQWTPALEEAWFCSKQSHKTTLLLSKQSNGLKAKRDSFKTQGSCLTAWHRWFKNSPDTIAGFKFEMKNAHFIKYNTATICSHCSRHLHKNILKKKSQHTGIGQIRGNKSLKLCQLVAAYDVCCNRILRMLPGSKNEERPIF